MTWSVTNRFKFKTEEALIFVLNHVDTTMVTETRHSRKNIRTARGIISLVEFFQIFCNVNKIIIQGFRSIRIFV